MKKIIILLIGLGFSSKGFSSFVDEELRIACLDKECKVANP